MCRCKVIGTRRPWTWVRYYNENLSINEAILFNLNKILIMVILYLCTMQWVRHFYWWAKSCTSHVMKSIHIYRWCLWIMSRRSYLCLCCYRKVVKRRRKNFLLNVWFDLNWIMLCYERWLSIVESSLIADNTLCRILSDHWNNSLTVLHDRTIKTRKVDGGKRMRLYVTSRMGFRGGLVAFQ